MPLNYENFTSYFFLSRRLSSRSVRVSRLSMSATLLLISRWCKSLRSFS